MTDTIGQLPVDPFPPVDRETIIAQVREETYSRTLADELVRQRARREARRILDAEDRDATDDVPDPILLADLLDEDDDGEPEWRIEGVWPLGGNVLLAAGAKSGKTTTTGNVVRSLVDGDRLFRIYPVRPVDDGIVTILDFEMPRRTVKRWLRDQGIRNTRRLAIWTERGMAARFDVRDPEVRARWVAKLRAAATKVWIIDCLSPICSALGINEDKNNEVGELLDGITAAAVEAEVSEVLLIHHMGHQAERSRGASRLIGWPDVSWRIVRKRNDKNPGGEPDPDAPRYFAAEGRDVDVKEGRLLFDPATRHLTYAEGGRKASEHTEALGRVLVWIRDNPGQSGNAAEKALTGQGLGRNVVRQALADAKTKGYVVASTKRSNVVCLEVTAGGLTALRNLSGDDGDGFGEVEDGLAGGALCILGCGCYVQPFEVVHGHDRCRACRIEAGEL